MAFTFRDLKGSPLTSAEADANIRQLSISTSSIIDYTNPTVISAATTLVKNTANRITSSGTGYTLTLPDYSINIGVRIFINIVASAGGLYPISGTTFVLQATETLETLATIDGWKRIGGQILKTSARIASDTTVNNYLVANNSIQVPFTILQRSQGQIQTSSAGIRVLRKSSATVEIAVVLQGLTAGAFYQAAITQTQANGNTIIVAIGLVFSGTAGAETYGMLAMSAKASAEVGDLFRSDIYAAGYGGRLRTDAPNQPNTITYTED